jgi:hypothetical protein
MGPATASALRPARTMPARTVPGTGIGDARSAEGAASLVALSALTVTVTLLAAVCAELPG